MLVKETFVVEVRPKHLVSHLLHEGWVLQNEAISPSLGRFKISFAPVANEERGLVAYQSLKQFRLSDLLGRLAHLDAFMDLPQLKQLQPRSKKYIVVAGDICLDPAWKQHVACLSLATWLVSFIAVNQPLFADSYVLMAEPL